MGVVDRVHDAGQPVETVVGHMHGQVQKELSGSDQAAQEHIVVYTFNQVKLQATINGLKYLF